MKPVVHEEKSFHMNSMRLREILSFTRTNFLVPDCTLFFPGTCLVILRVQLYSPYLSIALCHMFNLQFISVETAIRRNLVLGNSNNRKSIGIEENSSW